MSQSSTRGKTPGTSKPLIELIFSNITTSPTRGCEEVLHRIAQRPIAIYSGAKVINPNIFLRLLLNFQLAIRNRQTISIRGAEKASRVNDIRLPGVLPLVQPRPPA